MLKAFFAFIIAWWRARGPSLAQQEAEKVGERGAQLNTEIAANENITRTAQAGDALGAQLTSPDSVRDYAAKDPNNRAD